MRTEWQLRTLGDYFDITSSRRVFKGEWTTSGVPFYRAREIVRLARDGAVNNELFIDRKMYESYRDKYGIPNPDDILVTGVGTLGVCYVVRGGDEFYFKDGNIIWLKKKSEIDSRFVEYAFKSDFIREQIEDAVGATVGTFTIEKAKRTRFLVPSLKEQRRIVEVLDEAFASIAIATVNAEKNLANAREMFAIALNREIERGFPELPLKVLCSFENGDRGENYAGRAAFVSEGIPVINAGHLEPDGIDETAMNFISRDRFDLLRSGKTKRGDILFCLRGSLGKFAYNDVYDEGAIASSLIIIRPNERILPEYLCLYLASEACSRMIRHYENGTAQPNLGGKSLEKFLVPVPEVSEQKAIVDRLEAVRTTTRELGACYADKLVELAALRQSLLRHAFHGEMTEHQPLAA